MTAGAGGSAARRCGADAEGDDTHVPLRRAWVSLLSDASYASGITALRASLEEVESEYPFIVMITPEVPDEVQATLRKQGCELRLVQPWQLPCGTGDPPEYACERFGDCWAKLHMWQWETEFEQVVYLDADMLVLRNMDELLRDDMTEDPVEDTSWEPPTDAALSSRGGPAPWEMPPCPPAVGADETPGAAATLDGSAGRSTTARVPAGTLGAVQECFCPVPERQHLCSYRSAERGRPYFNAGLLVLRPSRLVAAQMQATLQACDLSRFQFAEQDFLNLFFARRWKRLSWVYNASKAIFACHRDTIWDYGQVKNVHYTMAKPWDLRHPCQKGFEGLTSLWWAAYAEPATLCRVLLQLHLKEKERRRRAVQAEESVPGLKSPRPDELPSIQAATTTATM